MVEKISRIRILYRFEMMYHNMVNLRF